MNYNEFVCTMLEEIRRKLGPEVCVEMREVHKNNGVLLQGLTITSKESNMSPTIYMNGFFKEYEKGRNMEQLIDEVLDIYKTSKIEGTVDIDFFMDFDKVKMNLYCRLINFDKNREFLEDVPYRKYFDLAVICYFTCEHEQLKEGFITITISHLDGWGISEQELFELAVANTMDKYPYRCISMEQMLRQMIENDVRREQMDKLQNQSEEEEEEWIGFTVEQILKGLLGDSKKNAMYVLTVEGKAWGAISMLYTEALAKIAEELESDLFILPSSIHEVIVVSTRGRDSGEALQAMVADINRTHVDPEEVLSDHVYRYLRDSGTTILQ